MTHKSKITPATSPLFCNPYLAKHTTAHIDATFSHVLHSKVYSKQFSSTYSILAYLFTAMLYGDTINVLCLWVMFHVLICFNGFNRFTWFNIWAE